MCRDDVGSLYTSICIYIYISIYICIPMHASMARIRKAGRNQQNYSDFSCWRPFKAWTITVPKTNPFSFRLVILLSTRNLAPQPFSYRISSPEALNPKSCKVPSANHPAFHAFGKMQSQLRSPSSDSALLQLPSYGVPNSWEKGLRRIMGITFLGL